MRVVVYVEGPSDKASMQALLAPLLAEKQERGILVNFFEAPIGDKKESVLTRVPQRAVNIILNDPQAIVIAMPDLYPKNVAFPHETPEQLEEGILNNFREALRRKGASDDSRVLNRFKVFCFKYDLEALVLAAEEALKSRLAARRLVRSWANPVEEQDHNHPPKHIVEDLFGQHGKRYKDTVDAPQILSMVTYQEIARSCQQCFKPFVDFLASL